MCSDSKYMVQFAGCARSKPQVPHCSAESAIISQDTVLRMKGTPASQGNCVLDTLSNSSPWRNLERQCSVRHSHSNADNHTSLDISDHVLSRQLISSQGIHI